MAVYFLPVQMFPEAHSMPSQEKISGLLVAQSVTSFPRSSAYQAKEPSRELSVQFSLACPSITVSPVPGW